MGLKPLKRGVRPVISDVFKQKEPAAGLKRAGRPVIP